MEKTPNVPIDPIAAHSSNIEHMKKFTWHQRQQDPPKGQTS